MRNLRFLNLSLWLVLFTIALGAAPLLAQERIDAEAVFGVPFGVGRITCFLTEEQLPQPLGAEGLGITEKDGRVMYPALEIPAFGKLAGELLHSPTPLTRGGPVREGMSGLLKQMLDRPPRITIYFLFRGEQPLEVSLSAEKSVRLRIVPRNQPAAQQRLLQLWWRSYSKPSGLLKPRPDYPPVVDNFLVSTLARRLNLRLPEKRQAPSPYDTMRREAGLLLGTEWLRLAMEQDRILGLHNLHESADQPLPEPLLFAPPPTLEKSEDVEVEPLAEHVPEECFYLRFGGFANFLWLQDTLARWGGDLANLVAARGISYGLSERMEKQLVLKQTLLSRMLGETVIADVAVIGTDMLFSDGASYGLLFHARNNFALTTSINQQRSERIAAGGVSEEQLSLNGRNVSYLSSADGTVRSYYLRDGDFHFVTSSKHLAERFLAVAGGKGSLASTPEFRHARKLMPINQNYTVWAYLSPAFFQHLCSPKYRIELARRLQAAADIDLVELALPAAPVEGRRAETVEELKALGLLPPDFGPLPDGSYTLIAEGRARNSLRGRRGAMLPVMDVNLEKVTPTEAAEYRKFAAYFLEHWGRMDPIVVGLKRAALSNKQERLEIDAAISPLAMRHFQLLSKMLGLGSSKRLAPLPHSLATFELALPNQHLFGGIRDLPPERLEEKRTGVFQWSNFPWGYLGYSGEAGLLRFLDLGMSATDAAGYARSPLGGWRREIGQFRLYSFQRDVLDTIGPELRFESHPRPAHLRLNISDPTQARLAPLLNDLSYARTRETSLNNLRLLHTINQQLHVPPADCRQVAELLMNAKLVCPLGGEYVLEKKDDLQRWTSTALNNATATGLLGPKSPEGFQSPPLSWFRGLDLEASVTEKGIVLHAELIMQLP